MPSEFDVNNFGIKDTKIVGNFEAAEEFLSSDDDGLNGDTSKLKTIKDAEAEEAKKKAELLKKKQKATPKEDDEDEDEEVEEDVDPFAEIEKDKDDKTAEATDEDKDKDEEKKDEENKDKESEESDEEPKGNSYEELYKDLTRLGIFTAQDGETPAKTGEELLARFQLEGQNRATQWLDDFIGRHGDDRKSLFQAIFIDGVDPSEYVPVYNEVQNFESLDITVEANQEKVYREFY